MLSDLFALCPGLYCHPTCSHCVRVCIVIRLVLTVSGSVLSSDLFALCPGLYCHPSCSHCVRVCIVIRLVRTGLSGLYCHPTCSHCVRVCIVIRLVRTVMRVCIVIRLVRTVSGSVLSSDLFALDAGLYCHPSCSHCVRVCIVYPDLFLFALCPGLYCHPIRLVRTLVRVCIVIRLVRNRSGSHLCTEHSGYITVHSRCSCFFYSFHPIKVSAAKHRVSEI